MEFSRKKLPQEAAPTMRPSPIGTVKPYVPMLAPVYVFMKANEKFVAVKAPLDFFTDEELARYAQFETVYYPEFVESALPYRDAARAVKSLITWEPSASEARGEVPPPAPFEISDAVLRLVGKLWGPGAKIEPFFLAVLANELCAPIDPAALKAARDGDVAVYERAMFCSAWAVFAALHLGIARLPFLDELRRTTFLRVTGALDEEELASSVGSESERLSRFAIETIGDSRVSVIWIGGLGERRDRVSRRLVSRLERVRAELIADGAITPTIFGQRGFVNA